MSRLLDWNLQALFQLPFGVRYLKQGPAEPHTHGFHELVLVVGGTCRHYADGEYYRIGCGDIFVIPPGVEHCYDQISNLKLFNVFFNPGEFDFDLADLKTVPGYYALFETEPRLRKKNRFRGKYTLESGNLQAAELELQGLLAEFTRKAPGWRFAATARFQNFIAFIVRCYDQTTEKHSGRMVRLAAMIRYIEENFTRKLTLERIAAHAKLSGRTASRIFLELAGESPVGYLLKTRINQAAVLLQNSDAPISEIALCCGFSDSNYFALQFRRNTGMSPRGYRQSCGVSPGGGGGNGEKITPTALS